MDINSKTGNSSVGEKGNANEATFIKTRNTIEFSVTAETISGLPSVVQRWLLNCGIVDKEYQNNISITQEVQMLMNPGQAKWIKGEANQHFTIDKPSFIWRARLKLNWFMFITGCDKFVDGTGRMVIKLFSCIPVVNVKNNRKLNEATMQRFLAEIVWFPQAALSPFIKWQERDKDSAYATMSYNGTQGDGVFFFDKEGNFEKFEAMRFKDVKDAQPTKWMVSAVKTELVNGIKMPAQAQVAWELENGPWVWLKVKIVSTTLGKTI